MSIKTLLTVLITTFTASTVMAGGWVSGGGELIKDAHNPWFLSNTEKVEYCIEIDQNNFSLNKNIAKTRILEAIEYWKREFREAHSWSKIKIATQEFVERSCSQNVDLRFQLGVLSSEQFDYLKNPKRFIGISVRQEYDPVQLRGKGFIYISPDRGPLKFDLNTKNRVFWSKKGGTTFKWIMVHELGHIFGVPHDNSSNFMDASWPENTVRWLAANGEGLHEDQDYDYFRYRPGKRIQLAICTDHSSLPPQGNEFKFFGADKDHSCITTKINDQYRLEVLARKVEDKAWTLIGGAKLEEAHITAGPNTGAVHVWLDEQQKVFPGLVPVEGFVNFPLYFKKSITLFKGTYRNINGSVERPINISASPSGSTRISGVMDGNLLGDVFANE